MAQLQPINWDETIKMCENLSNFSKIQRRKEQLSSGVFWPNATEDSWLGTIQKTINKKNTLSNEYTKKELIALIDYKKINEKSFTKILPFVVSELSSKEKKKFKYRIHYWSNRDKILDTSKKNNKKKREQQQNLNRNLFT